MKKIMINLVITILAFVVLMPISGIGQEKEVYVKTVKVVDGEKIVTDTSFVIDGDSDNIAKSISWTYDSDSLGNVNVFVDTNGDKKTVMIVSTDDDDTPMPNGVLVKTYAIEIKDDENGDSKMIFIGNDDSDAVFDTEVLLKDLKGQLEGLQDLKIELDGENIVMLNKLGEMNEQLKLQELESLSGNYDFDDLEVFVNKTYDSDNLHTYYEFSDNRVTENELRDAGIKDKIDRLDITDYNINIDNGIVDFDFGLSTDSTPKVVVFNYFGDKVFTGKPELIGGKYSIKMDLSKKQHGTYYLQIIVKDASTTKKFKL